jgi:micrococcal nuclease
VIARGLAIAIGFAATLLVCGCSALTEASVSASSTHGRIVSVADGDTVDVALPSGATRSVRLLAMDSPEKYATRYGSPDECGALAASAFMEGFDGRGVVLISDPTQDSVDRYGRLLRYVQLPGGKDLGGAEVARGLAMPYHFDRPARRYPRYMRSAEAAREAGSSTWGPPCNGDFHSSVAGVQNGL